MLLGLMLASPAQALDIEPIRVRSAQGQPLLAEIPIDATPEELRGLRASLAPAVVFARVGLTRPQGAVADLRFSVVDSARNPLIRVTTTAPVEETFFTFLVQLEWSSGQMIREFSVALQDPTSMPVANLPSIELPQTAPVEAPAVDPAAVEPAGPAATVAPIELAMPAPAAAPIELAATPPPPRRRPIPMAARPRREDPQAAAIPLQSPPPHPEPKPDPKPVPGPETTPARPAVPPTPVAVTTREPRPEPEPRPETKPTAPPAAAARGDQSYGPVKPGEALSRIAARIDGGGARHEQALAALLVANPDAFLGGNINRLKRGAVLRLPSQSELAAIQASHARRLVHLQIQAWNEGEASVDASQMSAALAAIESDLAAAVAVPPPPPGAGRLEITPAQASPSSDTTSETGPPGATAQHAGGVAEDAIASREVELEHLRQRVADLEGSNEEMKQVIAIQDEALAKAQQRLSRTAAGGSVAAGSPWPWAALAGLLLAGLAIVLKYRRGKVTDGAGSAPGRRRPRWHRS